MEAAFIEGFSNWHKAVERLHKHKASHCHKLSMEKWVSYRTTKEHGTVIDAMVTQNEVEIEENRKFVKKLAKVATSSKLLYMGIEKALSLSIKEIS